MFSLSHYKNTNHQKYFELLGSCIELFVELLLLTSFLLMQYLLKIQHQIEPENLFETAKNAQNEVKNMEEFNRKTHKFVFPVHTLNAY